MKKLLTLLVLLCLEKALHAQYVYTIKADSVKITNSCDTAELIIENHTQNVCGFLFNKGRGRTEFRRGLLRINDSISIIGCDTLRMNPWLQGGNRFGTTGVLGTMDNNHVDFYTNGIKRGRLDSIGRFTLDYPVGVPVDAFALTTLNGTKKWFNVYSDVQSTIMSFNKLTSFAGDLESMRITAAGDGSTIETFAYSDLSVKGFNGLDLYGGYGAGSTKYIRFFPAGTLAGTFNYTGNFLLGGDTDYGYKMAVNGTTYSQFFTNSTTPLGTGASGALRLRWGGAEGTYVDFYYQGNTNRRGFISSPSDSRPLTVYDEIGFTYKNTPYVSLGIEDGASLSSRFTIASNRSTNWDAFTIIGVEDVYNKDFVVKANGNTVLAGGHGTDNGKKLQVYGTSSFRDEMNVGNDQYYISLKPAYGNGYGTGIDASMITFGNIKASIGVNKQNKGNIPANSLLIGGVTPEYVTAIVDYNGNPTFITNGNGSVTINGGYRGINNGGTTGYDPNANAYPFNITGCIGTGSGIAGDINFFTGNSQTSGTTIHPLSFRWTIKGQTGFLSNSSNPTSTIDINANNGYSQLRLRASYTPSSTSDTNGNVGDVSWDDNYFYIKTSAGWKRSALSTF